ncbi:MAG: UDP-2,3-diacylglucosamine diphosphatase [Deltaproteobacteria bacterium]|nr:UDP-2,3-diacylglucosamine diphosphatase [Deltaproteobacteria bacterium]
MKSMYFRSIWLSDAHLGSRNVNSSYLFEFLQNTDSEYLYLVGDIIDFWQLKKKFYWPRINNRIVRNVLRKARSGTKVIYIPGNHDDIVRQFVGKKLRGVSIAAEVIHNTADGRRFLVTHGDEFDCVVQNNRWLAELGSFAYEILLAVSALYNRLRLKMGLSYWSLSAFLKHKVKEAVNFMGSFEKVVIAEASRRKVDGLICGHIHYAAIKQMDHITYNNIGDWVESCTALTETADGCLSIITWTEKCALSTAEGEIYADCYRNGRLAPTS